MENTIEIPITLSWNEDWNNIVNDFMKHNSIDSLEDLIDISIENYMRTILGFHLHIEGKIHRVVNEEENLIYNKKRLFGESNEKI